MYVIPGTHKMGHLPWSKATEPAVFGQQLDQVEELGEPVAIELRAGQISIHSDQTGHGSEPNRSDRRRCGYVSRYCPPTVQPLDSTWSKNVVLCRGSDTTGYWQHHKRPKGEDVSSWTAYLLRQHRERQEERE